MKEIKDFLDQNQSAFKELYKIMKRLDTIDGVNDLLEIKARQKAISMVNDWITTLWSLAYPELPHEDEEEDIFRTLIK